MRPAEEAGRVLDPETSEGVVGREPERVGEEGDPPGVSVGAVSRRQPGRVDHWFEDTAEVPFDLAQEVADDVRRRRQFGLARHQSARVGEEVGWGVAQELEQPIGLGLAWVLWRPAGHAPF